MNAENADHMRESALLIDPRHPRLSAANFFARLLPIRGSALFPQSAISIPHSLDSDLSVHQALDVHWYAFAFGLAQELAINLENAKLYQIFNVYISETFIANFSDELRSDLEDLHLDEAFERLFHKTNLRYLSHKLRIDLEDARLYQLFHAKIGKAARFHLSHELGIDVEDCCLEKIVDIEFAESRRRQVVSQSGSDIQRGR